VTIQGVDDREELRRLVERYAPAPEKDDRQLLQEMVEFETRDPLTALDGWQSVLDTRGGSLVPFAAAAFEANDYHGLWSAARALERGEATPEQEEMLHAFLDRSNRRTTFGYKVNSILSQLPAFLGEFLVSGAGAGRLAARGVLGKAIREQVERVAREGVKGTLMQRAGRAAAETATMIGIESAASSGVGAGLGAMGLVEEGGGRVEAATYRHAFNTAGVHVTEDEAGELALKLQQSVPEFIESLPAGVADHFIEILSEKSGAALVSGLTKAGSMFPVPAKVMAAQAEMVEWWAKKKGVGAGKALDDLLAAGGWNGAVGEYLEERFGAALRAGTPFLPDTLEDVWPGWEQSAAEFTAFMVPGAVTAGAGALMEPSSEEGFKRAEEILKEIQEGTPEGTKIDVEAGGETASSDSALKHQEAVSEPDAGADRAPSQPSDTKSQDPDTKSQDLEPQQEVTPEPGKEIEEEPQIEPSPGAEEGAAPMSGEEIDEAVERFGRDNGLTLVRRPAKRPDQVKRQEQAAKRGEEIFWVDGGAPLTLPAKLLGPGKIAIDVRAPAGTLPDSTGALLAHETIHDLHARSPASFQRLRKIIGRVAPGWLERQRQEYAADRAAAGTPAASAGVLDQEEVARQIEHVAAWLDVALEDEGLAELTAVVEQDPGLWTQILDALIDIGRRFGLDIDNSMARALKAAGVDVDATTFKGQGAATLRKATEIAVATREAWMALEGNEADSAPAADVQPADTPRIDPVQERRVTFRGVKSDGTWVVMYSDGTRASGLTEAEAEALDTREVAEEAAPAGGAATVVPGSNSARPYTVVAPGKRSRSFATEAEARAAADKINAGEPPAPKPKKKAKKRKRKTVSEAEAAHLFGSPPPTVADWKERIVAGAVPKTILGWRKWGKPHELAGKDLDETIEQAHVEAAREIVAEGGDVRETFDRLVELYNRMPNLGERTSESRAMQAFSTPLPLGFLASRLARVTAEDRVVEPTAGHGALLLEAEQGSVNELDPARAKFLRESLPEGITVTEYDAVGVFSAPGNVLLANPPFGKQKLDDGRNRRFMEPGFSTTEIDYAITLRQLSSLPDNGRAVIIVGAPIKHLDAERRQKAYRTPKRAGFWKRLYDRYNVTDHFTVSGKLYGRQGAGWPVDVFVIDGRGPSDLRLPGAVVPRVLDSWDALGELLGPDQVGAPGHGSEGDVGVGEEGRGADASDVAPGAGEAPGGAARGDAEGDDGGSPGAAPGRGVEREDADERPGRAGAGERLGDGDQRGGPGTVAGEGGAGAPAGEGGAESPGVAGDGGPSGARGGPADEADAALDAELDAAFDDAVAEGYGEKEADRAAPRKPSDDEAIAELQAKIAETRARVEERSKKRGSLLGKPKPKPKKTPQVPGEGKYVLPSFVTKPYVEPKPKAKTKKALLEELHAAQAEYEDVHRDFLDATGREKPAEIAGEREVLLEPVAEWGGQVFPVWSPRRFKRGDVFGMEQRLDAWLEFARLTDSQLKKLSKPKGQEWAERLGFSKKDAKRMIDSSSASVKLAPFRELGRAWPAWLRKRAE
jgi:predicted RNA methylase